MKVLFVCLGNICRSPIAQGIFEDIVKNNPTARSIIDFVDSAGTANYHIGKLPDERMRKTAIEHGFNIDHLRGRQVSVKDFEDFDYIFAMDKRNHDNLLKICPESQRNKVSLFLSHNTSTKLTEVPDPFHGDEQDFIDVLNLIKEGSNSILKKILKDADTVAA